MAPSRIRRYLRHGTLPQLAVFEATARLGSVSRAAEELHVAQPTASVQIRKLAETVGMPLLHHVGRRVYLTEAGRRLHNACRNVFSAFEGVDDALADLRRLKSGRLQLAASTPAEHFAAHVIYAFAAHHEGIDVSLHVNNHQNLVRRLLNGEDDLFIFAEPPVGRQVVRQSLFANPLVAFAPADHRLAHERRIPLERLAQEPFLIREPGSGTRLIIEQLFAQRGLLPPTRIVLDSNEAIRRAIAAGLGVSILPRYVLNGAPELEDLVVLDVEMLPLEAYWYLAYPSGKQLSPVARSFMDFLRVQRPELAPLPQDR